MASATPQRKKLFLSLAIKAAALQEPFVFPLIGNGKRRFGAGKLGASAHDKIKYKARRARLRQAPRPHNPRPDLDREQCPTPRSQDRGSVADGGKLFN